MKNSHTLPSGLKLKVFPIRLAICRFTAGVPIPEWSKNSLVRFEAHTPDETSLVCEEKLVPDGTKFIGGWFSMMVIGPLEFSQVGILAALTSSLADAGISIFAISTFDTDYLLVQQNNLATAIHVLRQAGHQVDSALVNIE